MRLKPRFTTTQSQDDYDAHVSTTGAHLMIATLNMAVLAPVSIHERRSLSEISATQPLTHRRARQCRRIKQGRTQRGTTHKYALLFLFSFGKEEQHPKSRIIS